MLNNTKYINDIIQLIESLEEKMPMMNFENKNISAVNVGWHVQHCFMVLNSIINALAKSDYTTYRWKLNLNRLLIFTLKKIPRGKGRAPKVVKPIDEITHTMLIESLSRAKENVLLLTGLQKNKYFLHPYFGQLNVKASIHFLKIHTNHHIAIINDILKTKE
jgi:hypothetical protein